MKIKIEERERNACRIRSEVTFSGGKHHGSETRGSKMSVVLMRDLTLCKTNKKFQWNL